MTYKQLRFEWPTSSEESLPRGVCCVRGSGAFYSCLDLDELLRCPIIIVIVFANMLRPRAAGLLTVLGTMFTAPLLRSG